MTVAAARVILFVPADQPGRIERAMSAGADAVVIDLEDSVGAARKDAARGIALDAIEHASAPLVGLRVNALSTPEGIRDAAALLDSPARPGFVVLPKVESAADVRQFTGVFADRPTQLVCAIESCAGLGRAMEIALAGPQVVALGFGGVDLAAELGADFAWEPMLVPRAQLVMAATAAGIRALDVPSLDLNSPDSLAQECRRVRALGFTGKFAIHPKQVPVIRDEFTATAQEVADARAVLAAGSDGGAVRYRGAMLDAAVVRGAQRIIERADGG